MIPRELEYIVTSRHIEFTSMFHMALQSTDIQNLPLAQSAFAKDLVHHLTKEYQAD